MENELWQETHANSYFFEKAGIASKLAGAAKALTATAARANRNLDKTIRNHL
jgi:hypothetical protein